MKNMLLLVLFLVAFFGLWDMGWKLAGVQPLFPWQLKRLLREEPQRLVLVDVRTKGEYDLFHIPEAVHRADMLQQPEAPQEDGPDKLIVMICMTGHRSPVAAKQLQGRTQGQVVNLTWGMLGWLATLGKVTR